MSWWNHPGRSAADRASEPTSRAGVEIIAGKLSARVVVHEISTPYGPIPCWSYVTEGLAAQGQAELVFTLRRAPDEPSEGFPPDPFHLFSSIYLLAEQGRRVGPGAVTELGDTRFFGHHCLYVRAQPLAGVPLPSPCLRVLLVTEDELRAVRAFGVTRVLARMGQASSYYPFPPWADRRRRGLALGRTLEASVLSKLPRGSAPDVHVGMKDRQITASVLRSEQPAWRERLAQLPDDAPLALLTGIDPSADGCLVWVPGQQQPEAFTPPGSDGARVCGCFVAFFADRPANGGKILEDGFAMELTRDAWQAIRRALAEGTELAIPATGDGMAFALTWRDRDPGPIDRGFHAAESSADQGKATGKVKMGQVHLVTPLDQVAARTSLEDLAELCRQIHRCAERVLGDRGDPFEIVLRLRCRPEGHDVDLSGTGDVSPEIMQVLLDAIRELAPPPVRDGEVSFEVGLSPSR